MRFGSMGRPQRSMMASLLLSCVVSAAALAAVRSLPQQSGAVDLLAQANLQIDGAAAGDNAGSSVAPAGDVNGDGRSDLIIGAPQASPNGRANAGSVYVVFGRVSTTAVDLGALGEGGFRIDGAATGDRAGVSVASAGDVNGDGRADVIVGAYGADSNGRANSGSAWVVFGKPSSGGVDLAGLGAGGFRMDGGAAGDSAGASVASAGDVNGDGRADVIVGAYGADNNGRAESGSAYVIFGSAATARVDLGALGDGGFRIDGAATGDFAGAGVSAGDVDGDGRPDLIVAANAADNNGRADSGSVYVVSGKASSAAVDLRSLGAAGFRVDGAAAKDRLGKVGSAGDVNGDGRVDLIVGAESAGNNGRAYSGSVWVVFGKASPVAVDLAGLGAGGFRVDGAAASDLAGAFVGSAGDVNGDGRPDVVIGAFGADNNGRAGSGSAYVVFGKASSIAVDLSGLGAGGFRVDGAAAIDAAGIAVGSAGDVNGDGRPDVIVGANGADGNGRVNSGSTYVVFGFGEPGLSFDPVIGSVGRPLVAQGPKTVARTGEAAFSVSPALPAGLQLDPKTGKVSGIPSAALRATSFTVTMKDLVGEVTAPMQLSVTQPDRTRPVVTLQAKALQRIVTAKALFVASSCNEACILTLTSVVSAKDAKGKVSAITAVRTLKTAKGTTFRIVFAPEAQTSLRSLLAKGRQGSAVLTLVARDASGNTTTKTLTVAVKA